MVPYIHIQSGTKGQSETKVSEEREWTYLFVGKAEVTNVLAEDFNAIRILPTTGVGPAHLFYP